MCNQQLFSTNDQSKHMKVQLESIRVFRIYGTISFVEIVAILVEKNLKVIIHLGPSNQKLITVEMKKRSILLVGITVALVICANPLQKAFISFHLDAEQAEVGKQYHKPFPAKGNLHLKRQRSIEHFI
jgi:hypothetical protein